MPDNTQNKPKPQDRAPTDEYYGQYKDRSKGLSDAEKWGTDQNPVQHDQLPATNLRNVGPGNG